MMTEISFLRDTALSTYRLSVNFVCRRPVFCLKAICRVPVPPDKMTVTIKLLFFSLLSLTPRGDWGALAAQFAAAEFQHVPLRVSPALRVFYSSIALSPWACISSYAPGFHTPSTSPRPISTLRRLIDFDEIDKRVSLFVSSINPP